MDITNKYITDMQRQVDACSAYIDALAQGCRSPEKVNKTRCWMPPCRK